MLYYVIVISVECTACLVFRVFLLETRLIDQFHITQILHKLEYLTRHTARSFIMGQHIFPILLKELDFSPILHSRVKIVIHVYVLQKQFKYVLNIGWMISNI